MVLHMIARPHDEVHRASTAAKHVRACLQIVLNGSHDGRPGAALLPPDREVRVAPRAVWSVLSQVIDPALVPNRTRENVEGSRVNAYSAKSPPSEYPQIARRAGESPCATSTAGITVPVSSASVSVALPPKSSAPGRTPTAGQGVRLSFQSRTGTRTTMARTPSAAAATSKGCSGMSIT